MKYIGADIHISSVTVTVLDNKGNMLEKKTMAFSEKVIVDYISKIRGLKALTFEEGPLAQWLYNIIHDKVDKLLICDPKHNALIFKGNSNDDIDSEKLARLLRMGELREVIHPKDIERQEFRELINTMIKIQKDTNRVKNRLKATFRMKGIKTTGGKIYNQMNIEEWLNKLPEGHFSRESAKIFWKQLELLDEQGEIIYKKIIKTVQNFPEVNEFLKIKGIGLKTAAVFSAAVFTPFRFKRKSEIVSYCGLSLIENDTGKKLDIIAEKKRKKKIIKKLTNDGNKKIKYYLKSSARCAAHRCKEGYFNEQYLRLRARGLSEDAAVLAVSRNMAIKLWGVWKRVELEKNKNYKR